jgi:hypothetical protein
MYRWKLNKNHGVYKIRLKRRMDILVAINHLKKRRKVSLDFSLIDDVYVNESIFISFAGFVNFDEYIYYIEYGDTNGKFITDY